MHFGVGRKLKVGVGGGRVRLIKNLDTHKKGHWFRLCITLQKKRAAAKPPPQPIHLHSPVPTPMMQNSFDAHKNSANKYIGSTSLKLKLFKA